VSVPISRGALLCNLNCGLLTDPSAKGATHTSVGQRPTKRSPPHHLYSIQGLRREGLEKDTPKPSAWEGKILVPFPIESALSGVMRQVSENQRLWYRRTFKVPESWRGRDVLLQFGAVDWETIVWVNGHEVGRHRGGYDEFGFNITPALNDGAEQEIVVAVWDPTDAGYQPRGKQVRRPGGIWYTPTTGIWQTVWVEPVSRTHVQSVKIAPDIDAGAVDLTVNWSPDSPFLYDLVITVKENGNEIDQIRSYFGMRKISLGKDDKGILRLCLNNKPLFQFGPLDQGFWPDGIYTAPTDEALRYDIEMTRQLGFNMARKHVKIEPQRWYYWADKLGLLVWQDMPSGDKRRRRQPRQAQPGREADARNSSRAPAAGPTAAVAMCTTFTAIPARPCRPSRRSGRLCWANLAAWACRSKAIPGRTNATGATAASKPPRN
jgi:beta-galactosidase/beta-glucuronidase